MFTNLSFIYRFNFEYLLVSIRDKKSKNFYPNNYTPMSQQIEPIYKKIKIDL